jgi:hypothetical protein
VRPLSLRTLVSLFSLSLHLPPGPLPSSHSCLISYPVVLPPSQSVVFGDAMAVQTGALSGFDKLPVSTELFTKSRWSGIAPTSGAAQAWTMPGTEPPKV